MLTSLPPTAAALLLVLGCSAPVPAPIAEPDPRARQPDPAPIEDPSIPDTIEGEVLVTALPPDAIPAIDEPEFVTADEADAFMDPDETVLGVVGTDGTAKCYSAWQLDGHEIVNDELDGRPITATW